MRKLLLAIAIGCALTMVGQSAWAQGWEPYVGYPVYSPPVHSSGLHERLYYSPRFGYRNPYSIHFTHPYPQYYGRWDLYFRMHGPGGGW